MKLFNPPFGYLFLAVLEPNIDLKVELPVICRKYDVPHRLNKKGCIGSLIYLSLYSETSKNRHTPPIKTIFNMRTLILLVSLFTFSFNVHADQGAMNVAKVCRLEAFDFPSFFNAADRLKADLVQGLWVAESQEKAFQFHEYGLVDVITKENSGQLNIESLMWKVEQRNGKTTLILTDAAFNEQVINMEATCEGLNGTGTDSIGDLELVLKPSISAKELARMQSCLAGDWSSVSFPSDLALAVGCAKADPRSGITSMEIRFSENGSYTKVCETPSARLEESGFYEITPDGQYIIFYASGQPGNASETYDASVVRIQHLSIGELVLEQPVTAFGYAGMPHTAVRSVAYMQ